MVRRPSAYEPDVRRAPTVLRRLLLFAGAVLAPVAVGALIGGLVLLGAANRSDRLAGEFVRETDVTMAIGAALERARAAGIESMDSGDPEAAREFRAAARRIAVALRAPVFDERGEHMRIVVAGREWRSALAAFNATRPGRRDDVAGRRFEMQTDHAIAAVAALARHSQHEIEADFAETRRRSREQALVAVVAMVASLVLAGVLARRMATGLLRPLQRLSRAARAYADGDLDQRVEPARSAELRELGETFNRMAAAMQEQHVELEHRAFTDPLTGIPNRAFFERRARAALARDPEHVAVLMIDIDDFKLVNDGLGHASGDALIVAAAERISGAARPTDTVARLGGDEFAILLEGVRGLREARAVAERLRRRFDAPFAIAGEALVVSASVGVAVAGDASTPEDLLRRADLAMYEVKERGKNGAACFDPGMEQAAVTRLEAVNALRGAVARGELAVHYQPIVELSSGAIVGAEALMRWNRPGHGLVLPLEFIPLAEDAGLIEELGAWILGEACRQARGWRAQGHPDVRVGVNVSARQLADPEFERIVADALQHADLEPSALILEVTESSVLPTADMTIPKLERIVATGVTLALDDFGEGYSSLSHIRELPIRAVKIARTFVAELAAPDADVRLVRGIVEFCASLGLSLVAEGIEVPAQRAALESFGARFGQGFMFARPLEPAAFRALLDEPAFARA